MLPNAKVAALIATSRVAKSIFYDVQKSFHMGAKSVKLPVTEKLFGTAEFAAIAKYLKEQGYTIGWCKKGKDSWISVEWGHDLAVLHDDATLLEPTYK